MKNAFFLFAALLLVPFTAAGAAELPAAPAAAESPAAEAAPADPAVSSSTGCQGQGAAVAPLYNDALQPVQTGPLSKCGTCSSPECVGMDRGYVCVVGGIFGYTGNCNIYTGGNRCPGPAPQGIECVCGNGPIS